MTTIPGVFKKICKVFLRELMIDISVNNAYVNTYLFTHVVSQNYIYFKFNDFSMSNWSKIQRFFHDFLIFTNFKNFS